MQAGCYLEGVGGPPDCAAALPLLQRALRHGEMLFVVGNLASRAGAPALALRAFWRGADDGCPRARLGLGRHFAHEPWRCGRAPHFGRTFAHAACTLLASAGRAALPALPAAVWVVVVGFLPRLAVPGAEVAAAEGPPVGLTMADLDDGPDADDGPLFPADPGAFTDDDDDGNGVAFDDMAGYWS
jgi:hypothetical protein